MTTQPEETLERNLVDQLVKLGYKQIVIRDEADLLVNHKEQLEIQNKTTLTDFEFTQILNYIGKGNVFERAKILRDRVPYTTEEGDTKTVELINQIHWCQNQFQVTRQISIEGKYKNRYDVTLLINGLPLVQVELKRRGLELKEAFNQTNRYERHSYSSSHGLFQFIQLFVISNGVNTKYYANNPIRGRSFKQTFFWSDVTNKIITQLAEFTDTFLEPCHVSKMITKYIVLNETQKMLMVLRPYQFYATEAIIERVKNTTEYGYIWHTTGSGKTLTSFKTAQILTNLPQVHKVVFVVDRKDLDYQTAKEFNSFSKGSIDSTTNTFTLVKQMTGEAKLIVTTIQKLHNAISNPRYLSQMEALKDERIVFIFDECHRSQFGKTHDNIRSFFTNCQMFGFTGTPIFEENAGSNEYGKRTTTMLFDKCLHKYVITDAIRDSNVLKFSIEYIRTFKKKDHIQDIEVEAIDEAEVMNAPQRLENIVEYIIANHHRKTHNKKFTAILAVSSVSTLIDYYQLLLKKKAAGEHSLRLATIFSYQANEEDQDAMGFVDEEYLTAAEPEEHYSRQHTRDYLEDFIQEYNREFNANYTTKDSRSFENYYNNVSKRVKEREVDLLVVVNMFLTGFDSKHLNTLYVDKNLKYHGLIQAYSRTNRILDELKSQGNIVCFRNLKDATDQAITLFSNKEAIDVIIMKPYEEYVTLFNQAYHMLLQIAPTVDSVNELRSEDDQLKFIKAFRELMRLKNVLSTFTEFNFEDLSMDDQGFEDYKSKYLDLYDRSKDPREKEKVSILNDVDFELELIHRDEINVAYILKLLTKLKDVSPEEQKKQKKLLLELVAGDVQLRSKRMLIEKFIQENLPHIQDSDQVADSFMVFWNEEKRDAFLQLSRDEKLDPKALEEVVGEYLFTEKTPMRDTVVGMMQERPSLRERASTTERITQKIMDFVETFISGISD
jgi:type I restriction enzyme R subunit